MLFTKEAVYVLTSTKKGNALIVVRFLAMTPLLLFLVLDTLPVGQLLTCLVLNMTIVGCCSCASS